MLFGARPARLVGGDVDRRGNARPPHGATRGGDRARRAGRSPAAGRTRSAGSRQGAGSRLSPRGARNAGTPSDVHTPGLAVVRERPERRRALEQRVRVAAQRDFSSGRAADRDAVPIEHQRLVGVERRLSRLAAVDPHREKTSRVLRPTTTGVQRRRRLPRHVSADRLRAFSPHGSPERYPAARTPPHRHPPTGWMSPLMALVRHHEDSSARQQLDGPYERSQHERPPFHAPRLNAALARSHRPVARDTPEVALVDGSVTCRDVTDVAG
jgi:hypothetical protein